MEKDLWKNNFAVTAIHGNRNQQEREEALQAFRTGQNPILVATDVAARGLDIPNVSLVINYDMPKNIDDYVHRIGRTGRAGRKGKAIALINERQCSRDLLKRLNDLLVEAKQETPEWFEDIARITKDHKSDRYTSGKQTKDFRAKTGTVFDRAMAPSSTAKAAIPNTRRGADANPTSTRGGASGGPPASYGASGADDAW